MNKLKILNDINRKHIFHLEASPNYTILNLAGVKKFISGYSLNVFEKLFDENDFVRIVRLNLVNASFIKKH